MNMATNNHGGQSLLGWKSPLPKWLIHNSLIWCQAYFFGQEKKAATFFVKILQEWSKLYTIILLL